MNDFEPNSGASSRVTRIVDLLSNVASAATILSIVVVSGIMLQEFEAFRSIEQNDRTRSNTERSNVKKEKEKISKKNISNL